MQGTDSRVGRYIRGICAVCNAVDVLVYETDEQTGLVCATDYRGWSKMHPARQPCDECGSMQGAWRDPISRKNEYLCSKCHGRRGKVFVNRWAPVVWESKPLGIHEKAKCLVNDGNCRGEIKWRGGAQALLCNRHAGKEGKGPNG